MKKLFGKRTLSLLLCAAMLLGVGIVQCIGVVAGAAVHWLIGGGGTIPSLFAAVLLMVPLSQRR